MDLRLKSGSGRRIRTLTYGVRVILNHASTKGRSLLLTNLYKSVGNSMYQWDQTWLMYPLNCPCSETVKNLLEIQWRFWQQFWQQSQLFWDAQRTRIKPGFCAVIGWLKIEVLLYDSPVKSLVPKICGSWNIRILLNFSIYRIKLCQILNCF